MTRAQIVWLILLDISSFLIGLIAFPLLRVETPIHWNMQGEVDGYAGRLEAAFLFPLLVSVTSAVFLTLPFIPSLRTSLEKSGKYYGRIVLVGVIALVGIQLAIMLQVFGKFEAPRYAMLILASLFMVMGNWMGKIRRNKIVGIRTPWTLASDVVWERTHRVGGPLLVAMGLITGLSTILTHRPIVPLSIMFAGTTAILIWSFAYSWWQYHQLPVKPEAG